MSKQTYSLKLWMRNKQIHGRVYDGAAFIELELLRLVQKRVTVVVRYKNFMCRGRKTEKKNVNVLLDGTSRTWKLTC